MNIQCLRLFNPKCLSTRPINYIFGNIAFFIWGLLVHFLFRLYFFIRFRLESIFINLSFLLLSKELDMQVFTHTIKIEREKIKRSNAADRRKKSTKRIKSFSFIDEFLQVDDTRREYKKPIDKKKKSYQCAL